MRRLAKSVLALSLSAPAVVAAEVAPAGVTEPAPDAADVPTLPAPLAFTPYGVLFSRYELRRGYALGAAGADGEDAVRYRTRVGLRAEPVPVADNLEVSLRAAAQAAGAWSVGGDTLDHPALHLHEGVVVLGVGDTRVDVGRMELAYGEHLVLGNVEWNPVARAFDGVRTHTTLANGGYIDGFAMAVDEGWGRADGGATVGEGDVYLLGVYSGFGPALGQGVDLDAYLLTRAFPKRAADGATRDGTAEATVGTRYRDRFGAIDARIEAGYQLGGRPIAGNTDVANVAAWHADGEVGANFAGDRARIGLGGFRAGGDDPESAATDESWAQLYPTAHRWLGQMDVIAGRTNIQGGVVRANYRPSPAVGVFADAHLFYLVEAPDGADKYRGAEVDVGASQRLGRGLTLRQTVGSFLSPSSSDEDPYLFAEVELRLTFPLPN